MNSSTSSHCSAPIASARSGETLSEATPLNPLIRLSPDTDEPGSILELKMRIVLYLDKPPEPAIVRKIYDRYVARYGHDIALFRSTAFGDVAEEWNEASRRRFENILLPNLYQKLDWGYMLGTDRISGNRLFVVHGARPASEPGRASVLRFDFEWDFDAVELRTFAGHVLSDIECVCGTAGFVLVPDEVDSEESGEDLMFAWAMRYWGVEAQDLDVSADHALSGFPCISWLTVIGPSLAVNDRDAVSRARAAAFASYEVNGHVLIQTEASPRLIDRNRRESLGNYPAVAQALLPLQSKDHGPFSGDLWDEDNTTRYLHRFEDPVGL